MASTDTEPDGCSRRHWVSPAYKIKITKKKKKKKKKKKNFLANTPGFLVWIADYTVGYFFTHSKASSPANGF